MSTVFITGAHGFIGQHLARALAATGARVGGLGHGAWPPAEAAASGVAHWINGDITATNLRLLTASLGTPDTVFHLAGGSSVGAAIANPREDFARTVSTTVELLEWMRLDAPQARLVAVSSAAVYGAGHEGPIREDARLEPFSPYGHHKLMMEQLCRSYGASFGLQSVVARLFSVFGPGLRKQLLWDTCTRLEAGESPLVLGGTGDELRDWTDVRDVVRALVRLPTQASPRAEPINVGSGRGLPVSAVVAALVQSFRGTPDAAVPVRFSGQSRPGDPFSLVASDAKLGSMGFTWEKPVPEAFRDYVQWFRGRGVGVGGSK